MERDCKIVTYDWLEDSLQNKSRRREGPYLLMRMDFEDSKAKHKKGIEYTKAAKTDRKFPSSHRSSSQYTRHPFHINLTIIKVNNFEKGCNSARSDLLSGTSSDHADLQSWAEKEQSKFQSKANNVADALKIYKAAMKRAKASYSSPKTGRLLAMPTTAPPVNLDTVREKNSGSKKKSEGMLDIRSAPDGMSASLSMEKPTTSDEKSPNSEKALTLPATAPSSRSSPETSAETASNEWSLKANKNTSSFSLDNYHIYRDSTGFDYDITLARLDLSSNTCERYDLRVSISNSILLAVFSHLGFRKYSIANQ